MSRIIIYLLKFIFRFLLFFAPHSDTYLKKIKKNAHQYSSFKIANGWQLKEIYSHESGIKHHFYEYSGPTPDAPVFLMLHGLFLDGRSFEKTYPLANKWRLIAYDFPEYSSVYRGDMNDFRYLLDDFLDTIKVDSIYLCGVSFGGGVALRYAASHCRRVKALILVSTFIMNSSPVHRLQSREIAKLILMYPDFKLTWLTDKIMSFFPVKMRKSFTNIVPIFKIKDVSWYRQALKAITTCEGTEDALQIKCPVLVLQGDNDRVVPLKSARSIPTHIPHAEFQLIENGTHTMMYLKGELLAQKIINFCKKCPELS